MVTRPIHRRICLITAYFLKINLLTGFGESCVEALVQLIYSFLQLIAGFLYHFCAGPSISGYYVSEG